ncbi:MAG: hypothetical protein C0624_14385 [Desulfuromonas sp.]|nr:MAG: hypothetical protein C0624_14385 [Desulfuromonas sp.]
MSKNKTLNIANCDVLLVQPPLISDMRYGKLAKHGPNTMPFGLATIAAVLEQAGVSVAIYDAMAEGHTLELAADHICKSSAKYIGLSFMTPMYSVVRSLTEKVKTNTPEKTLIFGGAHPTILPEQTLENFPWVDYLVLGEGDITFVELIDNLSHHRPLKNIQGIALRNDQGIVLNPPRNPVIDLDTIPMPAWHLLPMQKYRPTTSRFRRLPSHCILTSRGCPMNCAFCSQTIGRELRLKSSERVLKEIETLIEEYGARELIFYDSCFTLNRKHVTDICEKLISRGLNQKISWSCETRVDTIDSDLLNLLKRAGCWSVHFGVESGSQRLINMVNKKISKQQIRQAFKWAHDAGLHTAAFFMLGLPTETREESRETIAFAKELMPGFAQFTITVPFPGTPLYDLALESGEFRPNDWDGYSTWAGWRGQELIYVPKDRSSDELIEFQRQAMSEFFLQPRIILKNTLWALKYPDLFFRYLDGFKILLSNRFSRKKQLT